MVLSGVGLWSENWARFGGGVRIEAGLSAQETFPWPINLGYNSVASGESSYTEGRYTKALFQAAHAEGSYTSAAAIFTHAEGSGTLADAIGAHSEGIITKAIGSASHAEGSNTVAFGSYAHAEGYATNSNGYGSHTEGVGTSALNIGAHAEGSSTTAEGINAHAEGNFTIARSDGSHTEGGYTSAVDGLYGHAEGLLTVVDGGGSGNHAEGRETYSAAPTATGILGPGGASHTEGYLTSAIGVYSHAGGSGTLASDLASFAHGFSRTPGNIRSDSPGAVALGYSQVGDNSIVADGDGSLAIGYVTMGDISAHNRGAIAFGYASSLGSSRGTIISNERGSLAGGITQGSNIIAEGAGSVSLGYAVSTGSFQGMLLSKGTASIALGHSVSAIGSSSLATGFANAAIGNTSMAHGVYAHALHNTSYVWNSNSSTLYSPDSATYTVSAVNGVFLGKDGVLHGDWTVTETLSTPVLNADTIITPFLSADIITTRVLSADTIFVGNSSIHFESGATISSNDNGDIIVAGDIYGQTLTLDISSADFAQMDIINTDPTSMAGIRLYNDSNYNGGLFVLGSDHTISNALSSGGSGMLLLNAGGSSNGIAIRTGHPNYPIILEGGNIGVTGPGQFINPNERLTVNGNISSNGNVYTNGSDSSNWTAAWAAVSGAQLNSNYVNITGDTMTGTLSTPGLSANNVRVETDLTVVGDSNHRSLLVKNTGPGSSGIVEARTALSFVGGSTNSSGEIRTSATGSMAFGIASTFCSLCALESGAMSTGYTAVSSEIIAAGNGSRAHGYAATESVIRADGAGAVAMGGAYSGSSIKALQSGSIALGLANGLAGDLIADGTGAVSLGYANTAIGGGTFATGYRTRADGETAEAHGVRAEALHDFSYVWNSDQFNTVSSTATGQYIVNALGGVVLGDNVSINDVTFTGETLTTEVSTLTAAEYMVVTVGGAPRVIQLFSYN